MAIIRLDALRGLELAITCAIPELIGRVCVGQADAGHHQKFPSLQIDPKRWNYFPDQAMETYEPAPNAVVMNVGRHQAEIEIVIGAATLFERYALEQKLLDLFLSTPMHPGVLFAQITACEALGPFVAAWELDSDEWHDEKSFSQEFYSHVTVLGTIPALVTRRGVYTINQLHTGLNLTPNPTDGILPSFAPPGVEVVQVNSDGSITPVP